MNIVPVPPEIESTLVIKTLQNDEYCLSNPDKIHKILPYFRANTQGLFSIGTISPILGIEAHGYHQKAHIWTGHQTLYCISGKRIRYTVTESIMSHHIDYAIQDWKLNIFKKEAMDLLQRRGTNSFNANMNSHIAWNMDRTKFRLRAWKSCSSVRRKWQTHLTTIKEYYSYDMEKFVYVIEPGSLLYYTQSSFASNITSNGSVASSPASMYPTITIMPRYVEKH